MDVISVTQDSQGRTRVERRMPRLTRYVLAVILGGFAVRLIYYFAESLRYFLANASPEELRESVPGFALIAAACAVFTVPTWILMFRRTYLIFDPTTRTIDRVTHYLIFRRRQQVPFGRIVRVTLKRHAVTSKGRTSVTYPVRLVLDDASELRAGAPEAHAEGQALRTRITQLLGLPDRPDDDE